jgi:hypothetical protein
MSKKYSFKDHPEHKEQLDAWRDKWIANAMSTKPMDDHDRAQMRIAIKGLYESAGITPPPEHRIVFVPSPMVACFAGGFAAAIWCKRKNNATDDATYAATREATDVATRQATYVATYDATYAATREAIDDATDAATREATDVATYAATREATDDAAREATYDATYAATREATDVATDAATDDAAREATYDATDDATYDATREATDDATRDATYDATYAATREATDDATRDATYDATREATDAATSEAINKNWYSSVSGYILAGIKLNIGKFGFECAVKSYRMYQGGNFWSSWDSFISFFRHVAKLDIDYSKYQYWEMAAMHGSYRIMHSEFCIISDRPELLMVDEQNRPHNANGPFCKWRDGMSLYSYHGVRVPEWVIMQKELITPEEILKEENAEVRRVMAEIYGFRRFGESLIKSGKAKLISEQSVWGEPVKYYHYKDGEEITLGFIHVINGTIEPDGTQHEFILTVKADNDNAEQAVLSTYPDLMARLEDMPNKWDIIKRSVRS